MAGRREALFRGLAFAAAISIPFAPALALEGGTGAYLLGSRDTFAGIVPAPGTYLTENFYYISGTGPTLSLGGQAIVNPDIDVWLSKLDIAHFFQGQVLGGTAGVVLSIPYAWGSASGSVTGAALQRFEDQNHGFGDPTLTGLVGWHNGNFHYSAALSVFIPVGKYNTASITSLAPLEVENALNFGKNKWAFLPAFNATYFNPQTGFELSGSISVTLNAENPTTDWLTAPELNVEAAMLQHLRNGFAFGVAGYAYQQLGEDSGSGADNFKTVVGAKSLEARVFGVGPILTYGTKIGNTPISFKLKYTHEFGSKRRFESDVFSGAIGVSF
jgi:hypothetical protein